MTSLLGKLLEYSEAPITRARLSRFPCYSNSKPFLMISPSVICYRPLWAPAIFRTIFRFAQKFEIVGSTVLVLLVTGQFRRGKSINKAQKINLRDTPFGSQFSRPGSSSSSREKADKPKTKNVTVNQQRMNSSLSEFVAFILVAFRFPNDKETYPMDKQFLLGPALLITPVLVQVGRAFFSLCVSHICILHAFILSACFQHQMACCATWHACRPFSH